MCRRIFGKISNYTGLNSAILRFEHFDEYQKIGNNQRAENQSGQPEYIQPHENTQKSHNWMNIAHLAGNVHPDKIIHIAKDDKSSDADHKAFGDLSHSEKYDGDGNPNDTGTYQWNDGGRSCKYSPKTGIFNSGIQV